MHDAIITSDWDPQNVPGTSEFHAGPQWDPKAEIELVYEDGVPMESYRHSTQLDLLLELTHRAMNEGGRADYFAGGDMFVYYSVEQARFIADHEPEEYRHFIGPDYFFVGSVRPGERPVWVVWNEGERYPEVVIELLSPSTEKIDRGEKKRRYERLFATPEYYLYTPGADDFEAFHLGPRGRYRKARRNRAGQVWSEVLGLWLGTWQGRFRHGDGSWLRFYDADGRPIPTGDEEVLDQRRVVDEAEARAAEAEARAAGAEARAAGAEAELARLRALVGETQST